MTESIDIEVVYATRERQELVALRVPAGSSALEAVERSGLRHSFPEMVVEEDALGVFGRRVPPGYVMQQGDRLEIYRPLKADPKEVRRQRALRQSGK